MLAPLDIRARPSKVCVQPFSSDKATGSPLSSPFALSWTCTASGRRPSWSSASSQALVTVTEVSSGTCLLVMVRPSAASPDLEARYPSGTPASSTS